VIHTPSITKQLREQDPVDGWAVYDDTRTATVVCHCGLNTGWIDIAEAAALWRDHRTPVAAANG
jgi:hypothetical protein